MLLSTPPEEGHAGAVVGTALPGDPPPATPAEVDVTRSTAVLDQVFAEVSAQPKKTHFGLGLEPPWNPDLLEELALSWPLS
jgi:hypothetical protein